MNADNPTKDLIKALHEAAKEDVCEWKEVFYIPGCMIKFDTLCGEQFGVIGCQFKVINYCPICGREMRVVK